MSAKYEELVKAGAPRLPEGYYYKIDTCTNSNGTPMLRVRIYRERSWWFDQLQGRRHVEYFKHVRDAEDVALCCAYAYRDAMPEQLSAIVKPFIGRHP